MTPSLSFRSVWPFCLLAVALLAGACDTAPPSPSPSPGGNIVEGVDLDELFAPPTFGEINVVLNEWEARRPLTRTVDSYTVEQSFMQRLLDEVLTIHVVSHRVDGLLHYGAIILPEDAAPVSLPVVVLAHGGTAGANVNELLTFVALTFGGELTQYIYVIPSFRDETLQFGDATFQSEGPASVWNYDVDDALALLSATLENIPAADPEQVGVIGFSRGSTVAMLMALRDERIDVAVDFFGPTDFSGTFGRIIVRQALEGTIFQMAGVPYLNDTFVQPLKNGEITMAAMRRELLRRSPVYFTEGFQQFQLQLHHGRQDIIVPVGESLRLISVLGDLGRTEPDFQPFLYDFGDHDLNTLPGSLNRTNVFLQRLLAKDE